MEFTFVLNKLHIYISQNKEYTVEGIYVYRLYTIVSLYIMSYEMNLLSMLEFQTIKLIAADPT